jgi:hypothetical protein
MDIIDCTWEIDNIGERTCEVLVSANDEFNLAEIEKLENCFSYQVIKVAAGNVPYLLKLQNSHFSLIETQIDWVTKMVDFNYHHPLVSRFLPSLSFEDITSDVELENLLSHIDNNMFSTDRIALDPLYGLAVGRKRYCNWIRTEFEKKSSFISYISFENTKVGFIMLKVNGKKAYGSLAGIFKEYQDCGFGVLTSASMPLYILDRKLPVNLYETSTSSNNTVNTKIYSTLGFQLNSMKYVLIKHLSSKE